MLTFRLDHRGKDDGGTQRVEAIAVGGRLSPQILGYGRDVDGDRAELLAIGHGMAELGRIIVRDVRNGEQCALWGSVRAWFRPAPPPTLVGRDEGDLAAMALGHELSGCAD